MPRSSERGKFSLFSVAGAKRSSCCESSDLATKLCLFTS